MHTFLIAGAGKIGRLMAGLFADGNRYQVYLADKQFDDELNALAKRLPHLQLTVLDVENQAALQDLIKQRQVQSLISCLPYYHNIALAALAKELHLNYFDLTEDVATSNAIRTLAHNAATIFMPHCGVAPGLVNIVAHALMRQFDELGSARLRVGALPQSINNALSYALTWSTEGLINQYANGCLAIENEQSVRLSPLEGLENLIIDGVCYEAFNTSGGVGTLIDTYAGKIKQLNYKTLRYPGHCEKMRFLMRDLNLSADRKTLKTILENAIPRTENDVVIVYIEAAGHLQQQFRVKTHLQKILPNKIHGVTWSAIQIATAASACGAIDAALEKKRHKGFLTQESLDWEIIKENRFFKLLETARSNI